MPAWNGDLYSLSTALSGLRYRGGTVQWEPLTVHLLWYGSWNSFEMGQIGQFVSDLGDSAWWKTVTHATDGAGRPATSTISLGSSVLLPLNNGTVWASGGDGMCTGMVWSMIYRSIQAGLVPDDSHAFYLFLTQGVSCGQTTYPQYAGWHTSVQRSGVTPQPSPYKNYRFGYGYGALRPPPS